MASQSFMTPEGLKPVGRVLKRDELNAINRASTARLFYNNLMKPLHCILPSTGERALIKSESNI
jgi:hypothetical protein